MYAVTIKKVGKDNYVLNSFYDKYIAFLYRCFNLVTYSFELDKKHRLHLHALCEFNPFKVLSQYKEVHIHIRKIYDNKGWLDYINKDIDTHALIMNEVYNEYLFKD